MNDMHASLLALYRQLARTQDFYPQHKCILSLLRQASKTLTTAAANALPRGPALDCPCRSGGFLDFLYLHGLSSVVTPNRLRATRLESLMDCTKMLDRRFSCDEKGVLSSSAAVENVRRAVRRVDRVASILQGEGKRKRVESGDGRMDWRVGWNVLLGEISVKRSR